MYIKITAIILLILGMQSMGFGDVKNLSNMKYQPEGNKIICINGQYMNNRPLYGANMPSVLLAGDRPFLRHALPPYLNGVFMAAYIKDDKSKWLQDFSYIKAEYSPNIMSWELKDELFPDLFISMTAVHLNNKSGYVVKMNISNGADGKLIWAYGAASNPKTAYPNILWELDPAQHTANNILLRGFVPEDCKDNKIAIKDGLILLQPAPAKNISEKRYVTVSSSDNSEIKIADASYWNKPIEMMKSIGDNMPIAVSAVDIKSKSKDISWLVSIYSNESDIKTDIKQSDIFKAFDESAKHAKSIGNIVRTHTPNKYLDAAVSNLATAIDGCFYTDYPVFHHGTMAWNVPYPGWRTTYAASGFGMNERVRQQAKFYIDAQNKDNSKQGFPVTDHASYTLQSPESQYEGRGRILKDQGVYNFQEVFFDQMIYEWRWTADAELEKILRPALELHLDWMRECFDPDDNGVYESYINVWASDSVWYNGAETALSTAYAHNGHMALAEMAKRAGDIESSKIHQKRADKIRKAMMDSLWIKEEGHLAEYREYDGKRRLAPDAQIYTIFLPIDSKMMTAEQAAQSLYYSEWNLRREKTIDGERCWQSNWVPYIWSINECYPGDNFHLALVYFQNGLYEDAWNLIRGWIYESLYDDFTPGSYTAAGSTDFNDVTAMFGRVIIEGIFGVVPDVPNNIVKFQPAFPTDWDNASINAKNYSVDFKRKLDRDEYSFTFYKNIKMHIRLPIYAEEVVSVKLNGKPHKYSIESGFGRSLVVLETDKIKKADIEIKWKNKTNVYSAINITGDVDEEIRLNIPNGNIIKINDPQEALSNISISDNSITANLTNTAGNKLVNVLVENNKMKYWQQYKIKINNPIAETKERARFVSEIPDKADYECIDISDLMNGDIRTIFEQKYISPRSATCSSRIAEDGFRGWCQVLWGHQPPKIDLNNIESLKTSENKILTPQGVPFAWNSFEKNIIFTSRWDNYPKSVEIPIDKTGSALWFLVAGSASHMQTKLCHGTIKLKYIDGVEDTLELVYPKNYLNVAMSYSNPRDKFGLTDPLPERVELGGNCLPMLLNLKLRKDVKVEKVILETQSPEVVVGLMGLTVME
ncbi:MAG: DUF4450 domain-containing protein [Armatimonadota bacterium]